MRAAGGFVDAIRALIVSCSQLVVAFPPAFIVFIIKIHFIGILPFKWGNGLPLNRTVVAAPAIFDIPLQPNC